MARKIKKIGVLTSGGDSQGMNAAVRAVVRYGLSKGLEVYGIYGGYEGLMNGGNGIRKFTSADVSNIIDKGGTVLYSARCPEFREEASMQAGIANCKKLGIGGLITIGGDGTFRGASDLTERGLPCIGIPGTIDNDITCTDRTIGFDTATNFTMQCIDNLRETDESHARCNVIEAMGRNSGFIAAYAGMACGAVGIVVLEDHSYSEEKLLEKIAACRAHGKRNIMVVVSEGVLGYSEKLAEKIKGLGIETKFARLAHIVRGGSPTLADRILATEMSTAAVDFLLEGRKNIFVCERDGKLVGTDIKYAIATDKLYKSTFIPGVKAPTDDELSRFTAKQIKEMRELCAQRAAEISRMLEIADSVSAF